MAIKTSCPHCGQGYTLADSQEGKRVRCKGCSEPFDVRADASPARAEAPARRRPRDEEEDDRYGERPSRRRGRDDYDEEEEDRPARRRGRREDEDEDDERPRPRRGGIPLWVWLAGGGGVLLLVVGVVLAVVLLGGSRVTLANYDKLKSGMSESEARKVMGRPSQEGGGEAGAFGIKIDVGKVLVWKSGDDFISATFQKDKLVAKSCKIGGVTKTEMGNVNLDDMFKGLKGFGK